MSARSFRRSQRREEQRRGRRIARRAALATAATAALAAPNAEAANFPVSTLANSGAGSLRNQIAAANAAAGADTITFTGAGASGEIRLTTDQIAITDDLTITGPGAGQLSISGDADNDGARDFATSAVALGDSRIFAISDPTSPGSPVQNVTITGLALKEGVADSFSGTIQPEEGGAITSADTALTLNNVTFTDNVATSEGGAVYLEAGTAGRLSISNGSFSSNRARTGGGAVYSEPDKYGPGDPLTGTTIASSSFTNNRSGGTDFGGLASSSGGGGALSVKYEMEISDTTITGNTNVDGPGGGAYLAGYGSMDRSVISGNTTDAVAGGLLMGQLKVRSSTISGNSAEAFAGGVLVVPTGSKYGGNVSRLDNTTVSGNSATTPNPTGGYGGGVGVYAVGGGVDVLITRNSTIAGNTASKKAGGILGITQEGADDGPFVRLKSSIVADNTAAGAPSDLSGLQASMGPPTEVPSGFAAGFSLVEAPGIAAIEGDPAGSNLTGVDPGLSPLGNNGGPTQTQALALTSPAIDAAQANGLTTDQRGQPRTVEAAATNAPLSDGTDMGAFEVQDAAATGADPDTAFDKKPKKKVKAKGDKPAKVKLKFSGTSAVNALPLVFECKVDKGKFEECKSPLKLKLAKGKHTVEVRAIDSAGRIDSTPVKAKIKVTKKKPKK